MTRIQYFPIALGVLLLGVLIWAQQAGNISSAIDFLATRPWGIATITDFYVGIALFGIVVWRLERHWALALLWIIPSIPLGFLVPAAYLAINVNKIGRKRLDD